MRKLFGVGTLAAILSLTLAQLAVAQGTVEFMVDGQKVASTAHNFVRFSAKNDYTAASSRPPSRSPRRTTRARRKRSSRAW